MSRDQLNELLDAAINEAIMLLNENSEFFPFAHGMALDGSIRLYVAYDGDDQPLSNEVISQLAEGLRIEAANRKILASAITYDVAGVFDENIGKQSAICVSLEHRDSEPVNCYIPYELPESGIQLGDIVAEACSPGIFDAVT